jgi:hypothetical protein
MRHVNEARRRSTGEYRRRPCTGQDGAQGLEQQLLRRAWATDALAQAQHAPYVITCVVVVVVVLVLVEKGMLVAPGNLL